MKTDTKKLTLSSLMCAFAYIVMVISKLIPEVAGFLQFDAKDVIIVMSGFIMGPVNTITISVVVAVIEMLTVGSTGPIGLLMNIISTVAFCYTASLIYQKKRTFKGAIIGLISGTTVLSIVMILWNYFITPLYMKVPREVVASMLMPVFLPFNLLKGFINSALTLVLYRPLVNSLSKMGLIKQSISPKNKRLVFTSVITGLSILALCIPALLYLMGII